MPTIKGVQGALSHGRSLVLVSKVKILGTQEWMELSGVCWQMEPVWMDGMINGPKMQK